MIFVERTAPGDRVRVRIRGRRGVLHGELLDVLLPGADRVSPRCPHFESCGGCHWQHLSSAAQLHAKRHTLIESLVRLGGVPREEARRRGKCFPPRLPLAIGAERVLGWTSEGV